jgi:AraC family transcriptional regulator
MFRKELIGLDVLTRLNRAMDYIEENICKDINLESVAKVTPYSAFHFQRMFCYIVDISLSEYIRRRKMTLAAFELQNSDIKVIDLAIKYGYDSADSFSRAFTKLHNVTPSQARNKGTVLKAFSKLTFHISIKGDAEMNYRIEETDGFNVVGLHKRFKTEPMQNEQTIPEFWTDLRTHGILSDIMKHSDGRYEEAIGVCTNGDSIGFDYYIAIPTKLDTAPEGFELYVIPKSTFAVFHFVGPLHETMPKVEKMIFSEWIPSSGYEPVMTAEFEVYSKKPHDAVDYEFWVYFPVKKK